jgi:hypothetical protein
MSGRFGWRSLLAMCLALAAAPSSEAMDAVDAFFRDCPQRGYRALHDESSAWDLHHLAYTPMALLEVEFVRLADWTIDAPLPGPPLQPVERALEGLREGYHRLPAWYPIRRTGELVDALHVAELSLGDAAATYSVATGGVSGPGSGMVVRFNRVVDWGQRVVGDLNRALGWPFRLRRGLVSWSAPERAVDGLQWMLAKGFSRASLFVARTLDRGLTGLEMVAEGIINVAYRRPHHEYTVFLRLPIEVYRLHEVWVLEHLPRLVVDVPEGFHRTTHAALAHRRRWISLGEWSAADRFREGTDVVIMTSARVIARAPASLRPYVVPAAWVVGDAAAR